MISNTLIKMRPQDELLCYSYNILLYIEDCFTSTQFTKRKVNWCLMQKEQN